MKEKMKKRKKKSKKKKKSPAKKAKKSSSGGGRDLSCPSGETRRFLCDSSSENGKFWEITVDGSNVVTRHGKVGTDGKETNKDYADEEKAQKEASKLIRAKVKKGYALE